MPSASHYILLGLVVLMCGLFGVLVRKNLIFIMISLGVMFNSVAIVFAAVAKDSIHWSPLIIASVVVLWASCQFVVGAVLLSVLHKRFATLDVNFFRILRG